MSMTRNGEARQIDHRRYAPALPLAAQSAAGADGNRDAALIPEPGQVPLSIAGSLIFGLAVRRPERATRSSETRSQFQSSNP